MSADTEDRPALGSEAPADPDARWYLNDEREFLLRSLEDAEREHQAGDLADVDHRTLVARDQARLAEVEADLAKLGPADEDVVDPPPDPSAAAPPAPHRRLSRFRLGGIAASLALILTGVIILVVHATQPGQPGQPVTGSITQSVAQEVEQQLGEAQTLAADNQVGQAITIYNTVLSEDPTDPDALANAGWLQWKSDFGRHGTAQVLLESREEIKESIKLAPTNYEGHLYLGVILINQDKNAAGAQVQFAEFLNDDPPPAVVRALASLIAQVYGTVGLPVPAAVATATTSTTSTTAASSTP